MSLPEGASIRTVSGILMPHYGWGSNDGTPALSVICDDGQYPLAEDEITRGLREMVYSRVLLSGLLEGTAEKSVLRVRNYEILPDDPDQEYWHHD